MTVVYCGGIPVKCVNLLGSRFVLVSIVLFHTCLTPLYFNTVDTLHKLSCLLIWTFIMIMVFSKTTICTLHYFLEPHCSTNIKSNNTNEGNVLEIIWGRSRCAEEILRDLVGDGRFHGEGRDKQRLILSDRQRRAALVWQRSCSFNASGTWRHSPASLYITAETQRDTCLTWLKRVIEFYSEIWGFVFPYAFLPPHDC